MTIAHKHDVISSRVGDWLVRAINPFSTSEEGVDAPNVSDFPGILKAAEIHGVLPLVLRALKARGNEMPIVARLTGPPAEVDRAQEAIRSAQSLQLHQTGVEMLLVHHAEQILSRLSNAGASATIVKGPIFARRLYPIAALRTFTDIDLLIERSDRDRAQTVMTELGFVLAEEEYRSNEDYFEDKYVLRNNPQVLVEIHSNLVHNPRLRRAASVALADVADAGRGNYEDATALLFVAAAHGAISHQFDRLQHVLDIALAASGAAGVIDADRLRRVSESSGVLTAVFAAVTLAARMFPHPEIALMASKLQPSFWGRTAAWLITPQTVLQARSENRSRSSWRRKALRQSIVLTGRKSDR